MARRKFSVTTFLKNFIFILPNLYSLTSHFMATTAYETKIAIKSLVVIFALSFLGVAIATTTWLSLLAMLYIYLISLQWTPLGSISIVLLVNVVLLIILTLIILRVKKNLEFKATRDQLHIMKRIYHDER